MHTFPKWMLIPSATVFSQSWPAKDSVVDMFSLCNPVSPSIIFVVCSSSSVLDVASGECCCASAAQSYGINNSLLPVLLYRVWWLFLPQNSSWGFSFLFRSTQLVRPAEYSLDIVPRPRFNRISISIRWYMSLSISSPIRFVNCAPCYNCNIGGWDSSILSLSAFCAFVRNAPHRPTLWNNCHSPSPFMACCCVGVYSLWASAVPLPCCRGHVRYDDDGGANKNEYTTPPRMVTSLWNASSWILL